MYNKIKGGTCINIQGLNCWIPPYGFGCHSVTSEIMPTDVIKRSEIPTEQYWEAPEFGEYYDLRFEQENQMREVDPDYMDQELETIRQREWRRRMYGVWVYINGTPTYLPGIYYFYLTYWPLDTGLPDYRVIDLEYFLFWQYCVEDPLCYGMAEVCKRRNGKTYRAACIIYECISRTKKALGGIQSKAEKDAQEVFDKAIVPQFQYFPEFLFFRPIWDDSMGSTPKGKLRFFKPSVKGKGAKKNLKGEELKSIIDYRGAKPKEYDGSKTKRLLLDESGKVETDVVQRHLVLKHCVVDQRRQIIGKMIVTSTVEEIGVKYRFDELWYQSDPNEREANGQTKSGLYRFFMSAARSGDYDIYGVPKEKETLTAIMSDRESLRDRPSDLIAAIRKEPLSADEAFKTANDRCHFNLIKLNDQNTNLTAFASSILERGNFVYENGKQDTDVVWVKDNNGRWQIPKGFILKKEETNLVEKTGSLFYPKNGWRFVSAVDPYDHNVTEDNRRSNGASLVKQLNNINDPDDIYIHAYVAKYLARPQTADILWEDMIKQCRYFGIPILVENQKRGIIRYFEQRGYAPFLQRIQGYKDAGIPSTEENKHTGLYFIEDMVENHCDRIYFPDLINDLIKFDVTQTQKFDLAMACLWTEFAAKYKVARKTLDTATKVTDLFPLYKKSV